MNAIQIIGLGAGDMDQLPLGIYRKLTGNKANVYVRTEDHPVIEELKKEGVTFTAFDEVYEAHDHFEAVYEDITARLMEAAAEGDILYAVPGHPMLAERTVQLLLQKEKEGSISVRVLGGKSYLDDLYTALKIDPIEGMQFIDGTAFDRNMLHYTNHIIFCQVYDEMIASDVKLQLLEDLPPEYPVTVVTAAGSSDETLTTVPLEELDRTVELNNLTSVYIPPVEKEVLNHQFFRLREVIKALRGPDGCPWDRKQTHESLRKYLIEEAYEVIDAINRQDDDDLAEELGDVLLQVMLHSQIGEDEGYFTVDDVIRSITDKMIRRHPHVFQDVDVESADEVVTNWDEIKKQEKGESPESLLDDIPTSFPALLQAEEIQRKAAKVGFDWKEPAPIWEKVKEEWQEFNEAFQEDDPAKMENELGDLLFAIVNLARYYKINAETALNGTNEKFRTRFKYIEASVKQTGNTLENCTLEELDSYWNEAKKQYKGEI
ncbi:bifunctional methyltransferase/pyrophosphohydrolase YabN [Thalassobacillus hwangdonensis]|uniref:Nucleoside triphosphate pyrophosphohydrolase n=1 Tax=Thalassobacillus hwangdonensis TaxID=546108 RepID=A0ABW3L518_9BACI